MNLRLTTLAGRFLVDVRQHDLIAIQRARRRRVKRRKPVDGLACAFSALDARRRRSYPGSTPD